VLARPRLGVVVASRAAVAAEIELAAGSPQRAAVILADLDGRLRDAAAGNSSTVPSRDIDPVPVTRGHVLLATGHPQEAQDAVAALLSAPGAAAAEAWLVTALAQDRLRRDASATESLSRALAYAEAEDAVLGFVRPIPRLPALLRRHLDVVGTHRAFTERVLDRVVAQASDLTSGPRRAEPVQLTERELSVLAYLPTLSTNPEIAVQLNISVNTVKQHLKTINRKLDVSSRREAVRAARRLGLLPDAAESGAR
jgi:LuxR family transcriptional regulator, maltose regulon positive regulatory protein